MLSLTTVQHTGHTGTAGDCSVHQHIIWAVLYINTSYGHCWGLLCTSTHHTGTVLGTVLYINTVTLLGRQSMTKQN